MERFLCTLYTVRGSNKQGNVTRVNKMNCCIYCTHVCLNLSETSLKTSYSKLRSVEPDKHFPNYRPCRVFIKYFLHKSLTSYSLSLQPSTANQIHKPSQKPSQAPIIINLDGHLIGTVVNEQC